MTTRRLTVSVVVLLAACGGGSGDDGGGPGGGPGTITAPATVAEYCDTFWGTFAERWAACEHGSAAYYAGWYDPAARCTDPVQAVAAGRASYERARAGACLAFVGSTDCEQLEALADGRLTQADCKGAIAGKGAEWDECFSDASCASDLCFGAPASCPSMCVTPLAQGEPCGSGAPCAPGLSCRSLDMNSTCQPLAAQGGRCMQDPDCAPGLFCDFVDYTQPSTCQPRLTSGSCGDDDMCAIGYACVNDACVRRLGAGEPCTQGQNACGLGLWCGDGGTCVAAPGPGEACSSVNGEWRDCVGGTCRAGVCETWTEGATCTIHAQCAPTMTCEESACTTLCAEP